MISTRLILLFICLAITHSRAAELSSESLPLAARKMSGGPVEKHVTFDLSNLEGKREKINRRARLTSARRPRVDGLSYSMPEARASPRQETQSTTERPLSAGQARPTLQRARTYTVPSLGEVNGVLHPEPTYYLGSEAEAKEPEPSSIVEEETVVIELKPARVKSRSTLKDKETSQPKAERKASKTNSKPRRSNETKATTRNSKGHSRRTSSSQALPPSQASTYESVTAQLAALSITGKTQAIGRLTDLTRAIQDATTLVAVLFTFSTGLGRCQHIVEGKEALASQGRDFVFLTVDVVQVPTNRFQEMLEAHHVENLPTMIIFDNGHEVQRIAEGNTESTLQTLRGIS